MSALKILEKQEKQGVYSKIKLFSKSTKNCLTAGRWTSMLVYVTTMFGIDTRYHHPFPKQLWELLNML